MTCCRRNMRLAVTALLLVAGGCVSGPPAGREVLSDPAMRFRARDPLRALAWPGEQALEPLPPGVVLSSLQVSAQPQADEAASDVHSNLRAAVELGAGLGIEAGYGVDYYSRRINKFDGFAGGFSQQQTRHGPDVALLADDGTTLLRMGYRLRLGWEGRLHQPAIRARTSILSTDTVVEAGYQRTMRQLSVAAEHLPARDPVSAESTRDNAWVALEQGFLPGWNLRVDAAVEIQDGFLQSPYRLVTLWSGREETTGNGWTLRAEPEQHPDHRLLWGANLRIRRALHGLGAVLELGGGGGSGSWRVEHQQLELGWRQRLGQRWLLELRVGAYHQTRAEFYRNEYSGAPPGSWWTADKSLSSFLAWWSSMGADWTMFQHRRRLLGMFRYLRLGATVRLEQRLYHWQGISSPDGFSGWEGLAGGQRRAYDGGWRLGGWLEIEGGF
ncbi:MAG: hypothetical protein DRI34_05160 [Deltaproteobacteria bacterium]|nr:MAG: hypothetical protein DRI34_05160 [Deltaproteobacteria bacterium]